MTTQDALINNMCTTLENRIIILILNQKFCMKMKNKKPENMAECDRLQIKINEANDELEQYLGYRIEY